jgi:hypothetical protein
MRANNTWLLIAFTVVANIPRLAVVATNGGEMCSSNDESCVADDVEPVEVLAECEDTAEECANWASLGECDKNPKYMLGEKG